MVKFQDDFVKDVKSEPAGAVGIGPVEKTGGSGRRRGDSWPRKQPHRQTYSVGLGV